MPASRVPVAVAVGPDDGTPWIADAVVRGGGTVVPLADARALIWATPSGRSKLRETLAAAPQIEWVQLPFAGVENFASVGIFDDGRTWTAGQGVYADPVAEHALTLALAGLRGLPGRVKAPTWGPSWGETLFGEKVTILGGGGITTSLLRLLAPFGCRVTVVRRHDRPMDGAERVVVTADHRGPRGGDDDRVADAVRGALVVFVALSLTPETIGIIGERELRAMGERCWLVNVARGGHIVTDDLVRALDERWIAGAGLDVTEPEPLPDGHPLWGRDDCIITPHVGNTAEMREPLLGARVEENVRRFSVGEPLIGVVDPDLGY